MKDSVYKSYDELPLFLNAKTVAAHHSSCTLNLSSSSSADFLFIHFLALFGRVLRFIWRFPFAPVQQIVAIAGPPVTAAPQPLNSTLHINEPSFPQFVQRPPDAGLRTAARCRDGPNVQLAGVPATGAEYQVAVHRQLVRGEAVIKNLSVDLKKLFIKIPHSISSCSANRITEI